MIARRIILLPLGYPLDWRTVDYHKQTAVLLSQKNLVLSWDGQPARPLRQFLFSANQRFILKKISANFFFYQKVHLLPFDRFKKIRRLNDRLTDWLLRLIIQHFAWQTGFNRQILWIFEPEFYAWVPQLKKWFNPLVIYDCVDYVAGEVLTLLTMPRQRQKLLSDEIKLLKTAEVVAVNSETLHRLHSPTRPDVHLVPQGFRLDRFKKVRHFPQAHNPQPVIGYVGGLNTRLDFQLLHRLARRNPGWQFVLVGPIQGNQRDRELITQPALAKLERQTNIVIKNAVTPDQIIAEISDFDIAMIPYDQTQSFNRYCYPMKIFEYFYLGKPVISTQIEELTKFSDLVAIGQTVTDWENQIAALLAKPWPLAKKNRQRQLSLQNSWSQKIEAISQIVNDHERDATFDQ